jgi:hypothetical protein
VFRFARITRVAQDAKALLHQATRVATPDAEQQTKHDKKIKSKRQELRQKKQEFRLIKDERRANEQYADKVQLKKQKKRAQQEIFLLEREILRLRGKFGTEEDPKAESLLANDQVVGALPDFVIIGAMKSGTTSLYHLLVRHPHVEPAAKKELHYFDTLCEDEGIEWYRRCFPTPRWKNGRRTITGEATPGYLCHPLVPERMARVVPQARLIALLRNPVDRAYSAYQQAVRKGQENRSFEEAVNAAMEEVKLRPLDERYLAPYEDYTDPNSSGSRIGYLGRGIYVDQLKHWAKFFGRDQMLVLKSEDFFMSIPKTLRPILDFLGLPSWEPEALEIRNKGVYEQAMGAATRRRLEEFFEPHNRRLYEYLGVDLGW